MKLLVVALALVASACAYTVEDIPAHMRDRLDHYVALKKQWEVKWSSMSENEQKNYEHILIERLDHLPQIIIQRAHDMFESMSTEHRANLLNYLRRRFPKEASAEEFDDEVSEIESIVNSLPELIRDKLQQTLIEQFQEATAYTMEEDSDSDLDFPDVPELVDIPETVSYSETMPEAIRNRLDEFLLKREDWRRKWEKLSSEKREALEEYINNAL